MVRMADCKAACLLVKTGQATYRTPIRQQPWCKEYMRQTVVTTPAGDLPYTVAHRPRVTRRLHLELDASGGLVIVAPKHWSKAHISATLARNPRHIARFLVTARQRLLAPLQYVSGEQHLFLGVAYTLVMAGGPAGRSRVAVVGSGLHVRPTRPGANAVKSALTNWYRREAQSVFSARMQAIAKNAPWTEGRSIPLKLRTMRRTWGNCSSKGIIRLNTHLIKAPLEIVDAVIAHELCHLEEMNHGKAFYALLSGLNPNWRQDRAELRAQGHVYLHT